MPQFLGHRITDDPPAVTARAASDTGFIEDDVPLLKELRILIDVGGQPKPNPALSANATEIRDFITWASGSKEPPMPPLAVKILCLKRARIQNSAKSANLGNKPRTGEKDTIAQIDALLAKTGVKDPSDPEKCKTQGDKYIAPSTKGEGSGENTSGSKSCVTHVHCDNSAVVALLQEVMKKIDCLDGMAPPSLEEATRDLEAFKSRLLALQSNIEALHKDAPSGDSFHPLGNGAAAAAGNDDDANNDDDASTLRSLASGLSAEDPARVSIGTTADLVAESKSKEDKERWLRMLLSNLKDKHPKIREQIDIMLRPVHIAAANVRAPLASGIKELEKINGMVAEATHNVSDLPKNYKLVVNHLLSQINPLLEPILQDIHAKLDAIGNNVTAVRGSAGRIEQLMLEQREEMFALRQNVDGLYPHTRELTEMILDELRNRSDALAQLIHATHGDESTIQTTLNALLTTIRELSTRIGTLQRTNGDGRNTNRIAEHERLVTELTDLRRRLTETETRAGASQADIDAKDRRIGELEEELTRLRRESPRRNGAVADLEAASAERAGNIATKEEEIRRLRTEIEALRSSCDEEKAELRRTLVQLQEEHRILQTRVTELTRNAAGKQTLEEEVTRLRGEGRDTAALQAEIERLRQFEAERDELTRHLRESRDSQAELRTALETKGDRDELVRLNEEARRGQNERREEYERMLRELRETHSTEVRNMVDAHRQSCDSELADQKQRFDTRIAELEEELRKCRDRSETNATLAAKDREIGNLTRRCEGIKAECERTKRAEIDAAVAEATDAARRDCDEQIRRLQEELGQGRNEIARLRAERLADPPAPPAPPAPEPPAPAPAPAAPAPPAQRALSGSTPIDPTLRAHVRAGLSDSLMRSTVFGAARNKWMGLLNTILADYESGAINEESLEHVREFMKIVNINRQIFGGVAEAVEKFGEGVSVENFKAYVKELIDLFKQRYEKSVSPTKGGTRRRKQKSHRRTRRA